MSKQWLYIVSIVSDFRPDPTEVRETLNGNTDGIQCLEGVEVQVVPEEVDAISLVEFKSGQQD